MLYKKGLSSVKIYNSNLLTQLRIHKLFTIVLLAERMNLSNISRYGNHDYAFCNIQAFPLANLILFPRYLPRLSKSMQTKWVKNIHIFNNFYL